MNKNGKTSSALRTAHRFFYNLCFVHSTVDAYPSMNRNLALHPKNIFELVLGLFWKPILIFCDVIIFCMLFIF